MPDIGLFYVDSESLNGFVEAGESAERTVRVVMNAVPFDRRRNFVFWLETALKTAKQLELSGSIKAFRDGVIEEARLFPTRKHAPVEAPPPKVNGKHSLLKDFGF